MAEKRITTVDEMLDIDPDADYVLVSRGVQQDLRRILLRRLPAGFDIHDDISDELTSLAGVDRLAISDEGSPGAPQKFIKVSTLRSFLLDLFDLHDDVPTELTAAANNDRLLISDESEPGDPQKWISVGNLASAVRGAKVQKFATEYPINNPAIQAINLNHSLGRAPVGFFCRFICKTADNGFQPGDEVIFPGSFDNSANARLFLTAATTTTATFLKQFSGGVVIVHKDGTTASTIEPNRWRLGITLWA